MQKPDDPGWERIADAIDANFGIINFGDHEIPLDENPQLTCFVNYATFKKGGQSYKIERIAQPAIAERKSYYHKAHTGGIRHENIYDTENFSFRTVIYRDDDGEWTEIAPEEIGL